MSFRAPRYSYHHAFKDRGSSWVTHTGEAAATYPIYNLWDERNATTFVWSALHTDPYIQLNLGGGFETGYNRLIIPSNHNIATVKVEQADNEAFTTNVETLHSSDTSPTTGVFYDSGEFDTQASDRQYIRVTFIGTSIYFLSQLYLTKLVELDVGPQFKNALDMNDSNTTRIVQPSGLTMSVQNGPHQRVLEYEYEFPLTGDDLTDIEAMIDYVGLHRPFYVDPVSFSATPATDDPPLWVKFEEMPRTFFGVNVPMSQAKAKTMTLSLRECVE
jgi:hypothetical protein